MPESSHEIYNFWIINRRGGEAERGTKVHEKSVPVEVDRDKEFKKSTANCNPVRLLGKLYIRAHSNRVQGKSEEEIDIGPRRKNFKDQFRNIFLVVGCTQLTGIAPASPE